MAAGCGQGRRMAGAAVAASDDVPTMGQRRTLVRLELLSTEGVRMEVDEDGWRLINPRHLGQKALDAARHLLERAETMALPDDPKREGPPTWIDRAAHAEKILKLRITHRIFRQEK